MKQRQGVGGARLALDRDKDPAPLGQRLVDEAIMGLKADSSDRGGYPRLTQTLVGALERANQRPVSDDRAETLDVQCQRLRRKELLEQGLGALRLLRKHRHAVAVKTVGSERLETAVRPGRILEYTYRKARSIHLGHHAAPRFIRVPMFSV